MVKKALYKATSLKDLNKISSFSIKFNTAEWIKRTMNECFKKGESIRLLDEEAAYILFMRYFDCYDYLKAQFSKENVSTIFTPEFKRQSFLAIDFLEELKNSLTTRYSELQDTEKSAGTTLGDVTKNPEPSIAVATTADSSTTSVDSKLPSFTIVQGWILVSELVGELRKRSKVLIIDTRRSEDFKSCHIKCERCINLPTEDYSLKHKITFTGLSAMIRTGPSKSAWEARGEADLIVLVDYSIGAENPSNFERPIHSVLQPNHPLRHLTELLTKWDAERTVTREPVVLAGGMQEFLLRYAPLTTNPEHRMHKKGYSVGSVSDQQPRQAKEVDYPSLPKDEPAEPSIPASSLSDISQSEGSDPAKCRDKSPEPDLEDRLLQLRLVKPSRKTSDPASDMCNGLQRPARAPLIDRSRKPKPSPSENDNGPNSELALAGDSPLVLTINRSVSNPPSPARSSLVDPPTRKQDGSTAVPPALPQLVSSVTDSNSGRQCLQPSRSFPSVACLEESPQTGPISWSQRPSGLPNLGNTCYMNAAIQALTHTRGLVTFFLRRLDSVFTSPDNPLGYGGTLSHQFSLLFTAIWSAVDCRRDVAAMKAVVARNKAVFAGCDQQDSLEFLIILLDGLHEDMNMARKGSNSVSSLDSLSRADDEKLSLQERAAAAWDCHLLANESVIVSSFQGQLLSSVQCSICNKVSLKFESFMVLSLPLPERKWCSLKDCIALFGKPERMTGSSRWHCPRCKRLTDTEKKIDLWRLPTYLIIHLKRFRCEDQSWKKSEVVVDFPIAQLDPETLTTEPQVDRSSYALYAVVNHTGQMESGHYTAYCRGVSDVLWHLYDDSSVTRVSESLLRSSKAYLLFYERLPRFEVFSR